MFWRKKQSPPPAPPADKPEMGPEFYDANLELVSKPLETSPWTRLYETAADLLEDADRGGLLADLGCGTGRFARLITDRGFTGYWGCDFSERRVLEARRYNPGLAFEVASIFDDAVRARVAQAKACVMLEVLEHITRDREALEITPPGADVVISVPNYDSRAHVRWFRSMDEALDRFGPVFDEGSIRTEELINPARSDRRIFVIRGRRRDA